MPPISPQLVDGRPRTGYLTCPKQCLELYDPITRFGNPLDLRPTDRQKNRIGISLARNVTPDMRKLHPSTTAALPAGPRKTRTVTSLPPGIISGNMWLSTALKPRSNLVGKRPEQAPHLPQARQLLKPAQTHNCAELVPSHTVGKWSPKRAARLPFCTCCTSHWSQTAPLLVDGKLRKGSWERLLACSTVACIHLADSVQKRKLNCHWRHGKKHRARQLCGDPIYFTNDNPRKRSQAATPGLRLADGDRADRDRSSGRLLSLNIETLSSPAGLPRQVRQGGWMIKR
jgi:hypothetical protein